MPLSWPKSAESRLHPRFVAADAARDALDCVPSGRIPCRPSSQVPTGPPGRRWRQRGPAAGPRDRGQGIPDIGGRFIVIFGLWGGRFAAPPTAAGHRASMQRS